MYIHHLTSIGNCISRLMQLRIRTHQVIFCTIYISIYIYISVLLLLLCQLFALKFPLPHSTSQNPY